MDPRLPRILYVIEFLISLPALYFVWSQAGGQSHLDLMSWYWQLGLVALLAFCAVKATQGAYEGESGWNARSVRWLVTALFVAVAMGALTYYHHLNEPAEEEEEGDAAIEQTSLETGNRDSLRVSYFRTGALPCYSARS
jgi:hypothetical protein